MGGVPIIRDLRMPVATVVAMLADGMTVDEILSDFPDLEPEDIQAALRFAAEAVRERTMPYTSSRSDCAGRGDSRSSRRGVTRGDLGRHGLRRPARGRTPA